MTPEICRSPSLGEVPYPSFAGHPDLGRHLTFVTSFRLTTNVAHSLVVAERNLRGAHPIYPGGMRPGGSSFSLPPTRARGPDTRGYRGWSSGCGAGGRATLASTLESRQSGELPSRSRSAADTKKPARRPVSRSDVGRGWPVRPTQSPPRQIGGSDGPSKVAGKSEPSPDRDDGTGAEGRSVRFSRRVQGHPHRGECLRWGLRAAYRRPKRHVSRSFQLRSLGADPRVHAGHGYGPRRPSSRDAHQDAWSRRSCRPGAVTPG